MEMFRDFYENVTFIKSLNTTFLLLITKNGGVKDIRNFRPLSLLGTLTSVWLRYWTIV